MRPDRAISGQAKDQRATPSYVSVSVSVTVRTSGSPWMVAESD
ncbi:hypothetical protein [Streptomyces sp. NPDC050264]